MCGIYSILNYKKTGNDGVPDSKYYNDFMKIKHRGPDASKFEIIDDKVIIGHHRRAIVGLGEAGDQPIHKDGVYLIANAEIYNYKKLYANQEQEGYDINQDISFPELGKSDCEVILHLYLKYGIDKTCKMLDGEFAFIIYDTRKGTIYVARDHVGMRPLYVGINDYNNSQSRGFASEAMALTSRYKNVCQFPPGEYLEINKNKEFFKGKYTKWFDFQTMSNIGEEQKSIWIDHHNIYPNVKNMERNDLLKLINRLVIQSVKDRVNMSEVPVGCFLSGGLDSSIIAALATKLKPDIHFFSIGLKGSVDIIASRLVAKHIGVSENSGRHHIITVTMEQVIEAIPKAIRYLSTYDVTTIRARTYQYLMCEWISKNTDVIVLLSGEFPDESIPGYFEFHDQFIKDDKDFIAKSVKRVSELYQYDLMSDRVAAAFGLEIRFPFGRKDILQLFHESPVKWRRFGTNGMIEKSLLRDAFDNYDLLPPEILWRKKHAFSDAINASDVEDGKKSYQQVEEHAKKWVHSKGDIAEIYKYKVKEVYPYNTPQTYEAFWYRHLFEQHYYGHAKMLKAIWMPDIPGLTDPSATALPGHSIDTITLDLPELIVNEMQLAPSGPQTFQYTQTDKASETDKASNDSETYKKGYHSDHSDDNKFDKEKEPEKWAVEEHRLVLIESDGDDLFLSSDDEKAPWNN